MRKILKIKDKRVLALAHAVKKAGGRALLVGGFVRDKLLGTESKDVDVEVYGVEFDELKKILKKLGKVDVVGESFAVFKIDGIDVSIPRRDNKVGRGHKGFEVSADPKMSFQEASSRRDFTINALALDPLTDEILDEHGGQKDLKDKILRAVDPKTFADDPLRALRAVQLAARFGFEVEEKTKRLSRKLDLTELSSDRIGEEWKKLLLKAKKPSIGLELAQELLVIDKLHPELKALFDTPQEPDWHPEGTVWTHTELAVDAGAEIIRRESLLPDEALTIMLAVLCHDLGKPATTYTDENGRIRSPGHSKAGLPLAKQFMAKLAIGRRLQQVALPLIREHMFLISLANGKEKLTDRAVRRLSVRLGKANIRQLALVIEADRRGTDRDFKADVQNLAAAADKLKIKEAKPERLVTGDDLKKLGFKQGVRLGKMLKTLYERQLDGEFASKDKALEYLKNKNL